MPVYVDPICSASQQLGSRNKWDRCCMLYADSLQELMEAAWLLGLKPRWLRDRDAKLPPHFLVTAGIRIKAIDAGAVLVGMEHKFTFQGKS